MMNFGTNNTCGGTIIIDRYTMNIAFRPLNSIRENPYAASEDSNTAPVTLISDIFREFK
ncbi:hypothetical protein D3C74_318690 [compost metagenome]